MVAAGLESTGEHAGDEDNVQYQTAKDTIEWLINRVTMRFFVRIEYWNLRVLMVLFNYRNSNIITHI